MESNHEYLHYCLMAKYSSILMEFIKLEKFWLNFDQSNFRFQISSFPLELKFDLFFVTLEFMLNNEYRTGRHLCHLARNQNFKLFFKQSESRRSFATICFTE